MIFINKISIYDDKDLNNQNSNYSHNEKCSLRDSRKVDSIKINDQEVNIISDFL